MLFAAEHAPTDASVCGSIFLRQHPALDFGGDSGK